MNKILNSLITPKSYLNLLILFLTCIVLFVVGIIAFSVAVFVIAFVGSLALAIFIYRFADLDIGSFKIDTFGEAIIVSIVGTFLLAILLYLVNRLAAAVKTHVSLRAGKFRLGKK
ncbi:TPA: hypothetical protein HA265_00465 [Candidatus Woesearchaeota archaeon]|nr:hypothetical protein [Candidatus Woesearchaeota archaeon]